MKMAPIPPNFMSIVRLLTKKFVKIGSHFHEISLRSPNYQTGSKGHGPTAYGAGVVMGTNAPYTVSGLGDTQHLLNGCNPFNNFIHPIL